jgi:hypothetical protein
LCYNGGRNLTREYYYASPFTFTLCFKIRPGSNSGSFVLLGLLYDVTVPVFEKPDELKHFAVIQYIRTHGVLPVVRVGEYKPWDQEGTQPPLYHILAAAMISWLDLSHFEEPPRNPTTPTSVLSSGESEAHNLYSTSR